MSNSWPEADDLAAIFERFVQGDRVAQSDFIVAVLDPLVNHLRTWRGGVDEHMLITAAGDAVLSLIHNPSLFDKTKSNLISFLRMAAKRDLLNILERESKHHRGRENSDCVELEADGRNTSVEELGDNLPSFDDPSLAAEIACFNDIERRVFELMRNGEKRTTAFAEVMGGSLLPVEDQAREVKRMKDRITQRLKRAGRKA
jgi:hypothetical protein